MTLKDYIVVYINRNSSKHRCIALHGDEQYGKPNSIKIYNYYTELKYIVKLYLSEVQLQDLQGNILYQIDVKNYG